MGKKDNLSTSMSVFSTNLQKLRKERKLTQEDFADDINVSVTSISDYENGRKEPGYLTVQAMAEAFEVSIDELCGNTPQVQFQKKLEKSCIYTILTFLEYVKPQVHVTDKKITLTISSDNDCPNYSSREILKFFEEYEIIQNFAKTIAKEDMVKTLMQNLEKKYDHLPSFPTYDKISNKK